jgi:hypothetical protein
LEFRTKEEALRIFGPRGFWDAESRIRVLPKTYDHRFGKRCDGELLNDKGQSVMIESDNRTLGNAYRAKQVTAKIREARKHGADIVALVFATAGMRYGCRKHLKSSCLIMGVELVLLTYTPRDENGRYGVRILPL